MFLDFDYEPYTIEVIKAALPNQRKKVWDGASSQAHLPPLLTINALWFIEQKTNRMEN